MRCKPQGDRLAAVVRTQFGDDPLCPSRCHTPGIPMRRERSHRQNRNNASAGADLLDHLFASHVVQRHIHQQHVPRSTTALTMRSHGSGLSHRPKTLYGSRSYIHVARLTADHWQQSTSVLSCKKGTFACQLLHMPPRIEVVTPLHVAPSTGQT